MKEPDDNIQLICKDCSHERYSLKGKFSKETIRRAKAAKFCFEDPEGVFGGEHIWVLIMEVLASTSNDYRDRHTNKEMYEIFAYALQWVLNEEKK